MALGVETGRHAASAKKIMLKQVFALDDFMPAIRHSVLCRLEKVGSAAGEYPLPRFCGLVYKDQVQEPTRLSSSLNDLYTFEY